MPGPFVHDIDPIIGSVGGVHLWWYGLAYSLGFLTLFLALRAKRAQLGFSMRMVYDLSILAAIGVLIGGRFIEVAFYEWPFYREHLPWVRRFVARRVDDAHAAADLAADIFLAAIDGSRGYRAEHGAPGAWLAGVARNVVADPQARYYGAALDAVGLTPRGANPRIGPTQFEAWLDRSAARV